MDERKSKAGTEFERKSGWCYFLLPRQGFLCYSVAVVVAVYRLLIIYN